MELHALTRIGDLIGCSVENRNDELLGTINDFIVNANGCISYIILSFGGVLGVGARMVPIPWNMIETTDRKFLADIQESMLEDAPTFVQESWLLMSENEWHDIVDKYYLGESRTQTESTGGEEPRMIH
jgi:hypothetical protein